MIFPSLEMQKDSKYTISFFYSVWKETTLKPSKVEAAKNIFSSVHVTDTTCFYESFYSMWQMEEIMLYKSLSLLWDFFNCHVLAFIRTSVLKHICTLRYLRNSTRFLIPKFQDETVVHYIISFYDCTYCTLSTQKTSLEVRLSHIEFL